MALGWEYLPHSRGQGHAWNFWGVKIRGFPILDSGSHRTCQLWSLSGGFLKQGEMLSVRDLMHDGVKREVEGGGQTLRARLGDPDIS